MIVFCHLGWDWVWQRPQQFMSRFAASHRILFVEWSDEAVTAPTAELRPAPQHPNITILHGRLPLAHRDDENYRETARLELVQHALAHELAGEFLDPILWFYDPMVFRSFAGRLPASTIVYDCMDELSQFHGAPPTLVRRERELVERADVIFCGGRQMRAKRLPLNPHTHFFGTGVDCAHFGRALADDLPVAPDIAALPGPVLGYFGVVDERIDYELLTRLADARADWSIAIVGPYAKVDPAALPVRPNLHFLGGRNYADLPAITKGFSVCLMPFALNAATEFINPTKALEYMAAGKPVVSTALQEVRSNFGAVAAIAGSQEEFIALCQREAERPSRLRVARGLKLAAENSWESIIEQMEGLVSDAIARNQSVNTRAVRTAARSTAHAPLNAAASFSRV